MNNQAVTYASAGEFLKQRMKYCLNIYLSSFCGHYIKSYRKIKQRPSEYLSIRAKFMGGDKKLNSKEERKIDYQVHSYSAGWNKSVNSERKPGYIFSSFIGTGCKVCADSLFHLILTTGEGRPTAR